VSRTTRRRFLKTAGSAAGLALVAPHALAAKARRGGLNILFLFPDQHRGDWVGGTEGLDVRTPNLDTLAARGLRCTQALSPSPVCAPSRACLASGKRYDRCGVPGNGADYPLDQPTFYQMLRDAGYQVGGCGKFDLHKPSPTWGIDGQHLLKEWGFTCGIDSAGQWDAIRSGSVEPKDPYMHYLKEKGLLQTHVDDMEKRRGNHLAAFPTPLPDEAYGDNWVGRQAEDLLKAFAKDKPWFLQVNFPGPHDPWDITESMARRVRDRMRFPPPLGEASLTPEHLAVRQNYTAMVENIDHWVGRLLDAVETRGETDNTLVVYSSDHGEMLGDHGAWGKSRPHHPSARVPLYVAAPGAIGRKVCNEPIATLDLTATFLYYARAKGSDGMDSTSLHALLEGEVGPPRDVVTSGLGAWRLAFDGRFKLVTGWADGKPANGADAAGPLVTLWDLKADPNETTNVADQHPDVVARLTEALEKNDK